MCHAFERVHATAENVETSTANSWARAAASEGLPDMTSTLPNSDGAHSSSIQLEPFRVQLISLSSGIVARPSSVQIQRAVAAMPGGLKEEITGCLQDL